MKAIGVGCYWFARHGGESNDESPDPKQFLASVRQALEAVDNVSNVVIKPPLDTFPVYSYDVDEDDEYNFYPIFSSGMISFDLFMPRRLSERYSRGLFYSATEHFHVDIIYGGPLPVTYISYDEPTPCDSINELSPSSSVMFIREYLRDKLGNSQSVQFQCLGPSPFHADFFADSADTGNDRFIARDMSEPRSGYRTLLFQISQDSSDDLVSSFVDINNDIISTYYRIVLYRNRLLTLSSKITRDTDNLIEDWKQRGISNAGRWFKDGPRIDDVFQSILSDKLSRLYLDDYVKQQRGMGIITDDNPINQFIVREINDVSPLPTDDVKEILKILEDRRQGYIRNSASVFAGLIGGIVGAALTVILSSVNSQSSAPPAVPTAAATVASPQN